MCLCEAVGVEMRKKAESSKLTEVVNAHVCPCEFGPAWKSGVVDVFGTLLQCLAGWV